MVYQNGPLNNKFNICLHIFQEKAIIAAFRAKFPDIKIFICSFHIIKGVRKKLIEIYGRKFFKNPAVAQWWKTVRVFFYAPYVTNPDLIDVIVKYIDSVKQIVPKVNSKTNKFREYMKKQFFHSNFAGPSSFNHFEAILKGYADTTNNVNESLNHSLNSEIPYGRQNLGQIARILYTTKFNAIERLVEVTMDPSSMNKRATQHNAHRMLIIDHVSRFAEMSKETQKINLIRCVRLYFIFSR